MNKNLLIGIGAVILLGIGAFMLMNRPDVNPAPSPDSQMDNNGAATMEKKSLRDLMSLGANQMCMFTDTESNSSGTMYIGSGDMRGDFISQSQGSTFTSHLVAAGNDVYMWFEGETAGFKTSLTDLDNISGMGTNDEKTVDVNKQVNYSCSPWTVDRSKFSLPAGITFTDFGEMMIDESMTENGAMMESDEEGTIDQKTACQACESVPVEAQAQCREALGC